MNANSKILALCDSIASFDKLSVNPIYRNSSINKQFAYFDELLDLANCNELTERFNLQNNEIVKCYLFWGLVKKDCENVFELLVENLKDNRTLKLSSGGFEEITTTGDFFIDVMTDNQVENGIRKFTVEERLILDSILIYNDNIF